MMRDDFTVEVQISLSDKTIWLPERGALEQWIGLALADRLTQAIVGIRIVEIDEIRQLNQQYRRKNSPTNVLSFPYSLPDVVKQAVPVLGDIVLCAAVIVTEAQQHHKPLSAHWAHLVMHGLLHLLGYDHGTEAEAKIMENLEIDLLHQLGFANPYELAS